MWSVESEGWVKEGSKVTLVHRPQVTRISGPKPADPHTAPKNPQKRLQFGGQQIGARACRRAGKGTGVTRPEVTHT